MHFAPDLEPQYVTSHLKRNSLRVRIWFGLNLILAILFTLRELSRYGVQGGFWWRAVSLIPCAAAAWLVYGKLYERSYLWAARLLLPLIAVLTAVFVAQVIGRGEQGAIAVLAVNVIAAFFLSGLLFRAALCTALATIVAFGIASVFIGLPPLVLFTGLLTLTVTGVLGAVVYRDIELTHRRSFLERGMIVELAARDGLTGLMNRRAFDEHLLRVWQQAQRDRRTITILMVDIDSFKAYNDSYGHAAGDLVISAVAQLLAGFARRPLDMAARYGGEEFGMLLYDLAPPHVLDTAERIREATQNIGPMRFGETTCSAVTVSIGIGTVTPSVGRTPAGAVQLADSALYQAKRAGRNRVVVAGINEYEALETGSFKLPAEQARTARPGR